MRGSVAHPLEGETLSSTGNADDVITYPGIAKGCCRQSNSTEG